MKDIMNYELHVACRATKCLFSSVILEFMSWLKDYKKRTKLVYCSSSSEDETKSEDSRNSKEFESHSKLIAKDFSANPKGFDLNSKVIASNSEETVVQVQHKGIVDSLKSTESKINKTSASSSEHTPTVEVKNKRRRRFQTNIF